MDYGFGFMVVGLVLDLVRSLGFWVLIGVWVCRCLFGVWVCGGFCRELEIIRVILGCGSWLVIDVLRVCVFRILLGVWGYGSFLKLLELVGV